MTRKNTYFAGLISFLLSAFAVNAQRAYSQTSYYTSDYVGFHVETIKANGFTHVAYNVSKTPNGRHNRSINEAFGPNNEIGLVAHPYWRDADIVWVKYGDEWIQFYYNDQDLINDPEGLSVGWKGVGWGDTDLGDYYIPETSGFWIESKRSEDYVIAFGGYVRRLPMVYRVTRGFNSLNRGYPIPITLDQSLIHKSSGFKTGINGDIVWLQREDTGKYDQYYYSNKKEFPFLPDGWRKIGSEMDDAGSDYIPSAFAIQVKHRGGRVTLHPPVDFVGKKTLTRVGIQPPPEPPYITPFIEVWPNDLQPYFYAYWYTNQKVKYITEVYEPWSGWFIINERVPPHPKPDTFDFARILSLRWGVARIISEWSNPIAPPDEK